MEAGKAVKQGAKSRCACAARGGSSNTPLTLPWAVWCAKRVVYTAQGTAKASVRAIRGSYLFIVDWGEVHDSFVFFYRKCA